MTQIDQHILDDAQKAGIDTIELTNFMKSKLETFNCFNKYGKVFTLMKIIPQQQGHAKKIPWDLFTDKALKDWSNPKNPDLAILQVALYALYKSKISRSNERFELGMLVTKPLIFLDIDDIPNELTHKLSDRLRKIDELTQNTYSEISQSGTGVHFFFESQKTRSTIREDKSAYELYDSARMATLTGNILLNNDIMQVDASHMKELEKFLWGDPKPVKQASTNALSAQKHEKVKLSDEQLLNRIKSSKKVGKKFESLWTKTDSYNDSDGDAALCAYLIYWTNHDTARVDKLFRQSNRMRPKWDQKHRRDGATYGQMTIESADNLVSAGYDPKHVNPLPDLSNVELPSFKNNKELTDLLQKKGLEWKKQNKKKDADRIPDAFIVEILCTTEHFKIIYSDKSVMEDAPVYYFSWDTGTYKNDLGFFTELITAVDPNLTSKKKQADIINAIRNNPRKHLTPVPNIRCLPYMCRRYVHVKNGIFDVETLKLLHATPAWNFTTYIDTLYNPHANDNGEPEFDGWKLTDFLKDVAKVDDPTTGELKFDPDKYQLIWEVIFAGLIGASYLRQAAIFVDDEKGGTGKSTLLTLITNVLGFQNVAALRLNDFGKAKNLVVAENKTLIAGDENETNIPLRYFANIKAVISGEHVPIKKLYVDLYTTQLLVFIIQTTNAIPKLNGADNAVFDRFVAIKFHKKFNHLDEKDWKVKNDYINRKELLEWVLWYCLNHVKLGIGLTQTDESKQLLSGVQNESDTVSGFVSFIMDKIVGKQFDDRVPSRFMYQLYYAYCKSNHVESTDILTARNFSAKLQANQNFSSLYEYKTTFKIPNWSNNCASMKALQELNSLLSRSDQGNFFLTNEQIRNYHSSGYQLREAE